MQDTPWSYVVRFATSDGSIYLKHTPPLLALEAPITQFLHDQFCASVPEVIAHNAELHCFLMKDSGHSLRISLKKHFDVSLLCKAIDQFTVLQLAVADHVDVFLELGVPDWRLDKLPCLFQQLLSQKELLLADGLSEIDIGELAALVPKFSGLCAKLSNYAIKQTLVQCDFHDNNILIEADSKKITFIDLGEIVIAQPFFSLLNCLWQAQFHHGLTDESAAYQSLIEACLKNFSVFETKDNLLSAFAIARVLWFVYEALAHFRLMCACDKKEFRAFQRCGKLKKALKGFIAACVAVDYLT